MIKIPLNAASNFWKLDDEFSSDDEVPVLKRLKKLPKTTFPEISSKDIWNDMSSKKGKNVRYVPIEVEAGHPSTSTPNDEQIKLAGRSRIIPNKFINITRNGTETPYRKPRVHSPIRPAIHNVTDEDDEPEVTLVETKQHPKKPSKIFINVDEDDTFINDVEDEDDDVIFVKRVRSPPQPKSQKFFVSKNNEVIGSLDEDDNLRYYKLCRKLNDRHANLSPRTYSKFKAPPGITKTYRKAPTPVAKWMQPTKTNLLGSRTGFMNSNKTKSAISEVFNLSEKKNYQDLIRRVVGTEATQAPFGKPLSIASLVNDSASFRLTQRSQRNSLNELKLLEKGIIADKENESNREYDPITVASINSSDSEIEIIPSDASTSSSVKIDPVNSLRESLKDKAVTADDWLKKLDSRYKKKRQDLQEKLKDARRESDIISKVNYEQKIALLENKLKHELSIPESLIEEVQPSVELPALTPEQEKLVNKVLGPGPPNQLLIEKFNLRIHRRDIQTLAGLNWLNDEVINFYMNLLMQRCEQRKDIPKVYATNTFFYPKLMQSGQPGLRRWTRKVDIFSHDLMVVPVHLGVHWCLSIIDFRKKHIAYLDSMGSRNQKCLDALLKYLKDEHQDKKGQPFDDKGWKTENLKDIPQQMNGSDCGMFACTFAEFSSRNAPYTFTQANMPYLRRKAALEIVTGRLLL
ncbi:sentrin-specific protease 1-like isoform X2 [Aricia agestis]|uniref:sentrin-specific protease 1-like isoform X2 n=1 Tax=Aricia agestis TaxID=91739 RepID=UPI001C204DE2|nr:sentrin-specific protease 1-like isoform X2 [Aricia agestis]